MNWFKIITIISMYCSLDCLGKPQHLTVEMNCSLMCAGRQCGNDIKVLKKCALNCPIDYKTCWSKGLEKLRLDHSLSVLEQLALQRLLENLSIINPNLHHIQELKDNLLIVSNLPRN